MILLLTVLSSVLFLLFLVVLAYALSRIRQALERIHGTASKIVWGVAAIERQTSLLEAQLPPLQRGLESIVASGAALAGELRRLDEQLARLTTGRSA
ncbi:hypothetical protein HRbin26_01663 [bacterium HR26]|nr:hypothetical protein HRbin26_01663 [bacterium HR26]